MSMRSNLPLILLALLGGTIGLFAGRHWDGRIPGAPGVAMARIGDPAPPIALPDTSATLRDLGEWRGKPLLVNFWASWCGPCVEEMPLLDAFAQQSAQHGTQVLGIALDDLESVKEFLARVPVTYPTLIEAAGSTDSSVRLGNRRSVLPYTVLIDADGTVRRLRAGAFQDAEDLSAWADLR
jgi:thiol-disulfide isomerase/thioredoxin